MYENGDLGYLNVLISARSFSEFVERWEDLRLLIAANQRTVRARKRAAERRVASSKPISSARAWSCSSEQAGAARGAQSARHRWRPNGKTWCS